MFIAHLPAGYLTARLVARLGGTTITPTLIVAGMLGGIFPDIDLLYATLIDHWRVHHHRYWTHLPLIWLAISAAAPLLFSRFGAARQAVTVFLLAVWSHLLLDSVAGDIWWLWPWLDTPFSLVVIPAIQSPWWLNFLLHWTFAVEFGFVLLAVWLAWRPKCRRRNYPLARLSAPRGWWRRLFKAAARSAT